MAPFFGKADCVMCHRGPNFADDQFHPLGVKGDDAGRFQVTGVEADRNAFKTPTIRNVTETAPYMHDGSLPTLREVIFYDAGGGEQQPKSILLRKLNLAEKEKADLLAFLESLTGTVEEGKRAARPGDPPRSTPRRSGAYGQPGRSRVALTFMARAA